MANKIDERMFNAVKIMLESGTPRNEIEKYLKISKWSISHIASCESMTEYRNKMAAIAIARKQKAEKTDTVPESKPNPVITDMKLPGGTMSANYQFNRMIEAMLKQNELLQLMSNKLTYLVEQLT